MDRWSTKARHHYKHEGSPASGFSITFSQLLKPVSTHRVRSPRDADPRLSGMRAVVADVTVVPGPSANITLWGIARSYGCSSHDRSLELYLCTSPVRFVVSRSRSAEHLRMRLPAFRTFQFEDTNPTLTVTVDEHRALSASLGVQLGHHFVAWNGSVGQGLQ